MSASQSRVIKHRSTALGRPSVLLCALLFSALLIAANASTASALPEATAQWGSSETGQPVTPRNIGIQGRTTVLTIGQWGELTCDVDGNIALLPDGQGRVTRFDFDPESCSGSGFLSPCELESGGAVGTWPLVAKKESIVVGDIRMVVNLAECYWSGSYETEALADWEAAVDDPSGISTISPLKGEVVVHYPSGTEVPFPFTTGKLSLSAEDSELYALVPPPFASFDPFWTQGGAVLEETAESGFAGGSVTISSELGDLTCEVTADLAFMPGDTASVDPLNFESCAASGGYLAEHMNSCEFFEGQSNPWSLTADESTIGVDSVQASLIFDYECDFEEIAFSGEDEA